MYKLYYAYIELPQKVRIVSKKLMLDHTFIPTDALINDVKPSNEHSEYQKIADFKDLFDLRNNPLFDHVFIKLSEENRAYIPIEVAGELEKLPMIGWYDLKDFENGGFAEDDSHCYLK